MFKEIKIFKWNVPLFFIGIGIIMIFGFIGMGMEIHQESNEIKSGEICRMEYTPAHTEWRNRTTTDTNGNSHTTRYPVHVPDRYEIEYQAWNYEKEKFDKGDATVDETTFHKHQLGEQFTNPN